MKDLRLASDSYMPYASPGVTFLHIAVSGAMTQTNSRDDKRDLLEDGTGRILLAWTGKYRTDIFELDPPAVAAARTALGMS